MKHDDFLKFDYGTNKKQIFDILVAQIDIAISEKRAHVYIKKLKIVALIYLCIAFKFLMPAN